MPAVYRHGPGVGGLPATKTCFAGFAPRKAGELSAFIARLDSWGEPVVVFEGPKRVAAFMRALADHDADRAVAVCRELTKVHEEVLRGTLGWSDEQIEAARAAGAFGR